jgi:hypothetical protein
MVGRDLGVDFSAGNRVQPILERKTLLLRLLRWRVQDQVYVRAVHWFIFLCMLFTLSDLCSSQEIPTYSNNIFLGYWQLYNNDITNDSGYDTNYG